LVLLGLVCLDQSLSVAADRVPPGALRLLEDNGGELLPQLTNPNGDSGEGEVTKEAVFSGTSAIKITVYQKYFNLLPGWAHRITERPKEGEYRYLRLAWKSGGASGMMLQLHDERDWHIRYTAGANKFGWTSQFVAETPPAEWTVVTVDLFKDFGEREIHGIALTAFDGIGYFDHIYLGRTIADLDAIDATGLAAGGPLKLTAEELAEHFANLTSKDASLAYRSFWTLVAGGEPARMWLEVRMGGGAVERPDAAKIMEWIKQLDHDEFATRERATSNLTTHFAAARTAIEDELKRTESFETRTRLGLILEKASAPLGDKERAAQQARRIMQIIAERAKE
jgi:hypothetical protein